MDRRRGARIGGVECLAATAAGQTLQTERLSNKSDGPFPSIATRTLWTTRTKGKREKRHVGLYVSWILTDGRWIPVGRSSLSDIKRIWLKRFDLIDGLMALWIFQTVRCGLSTTSTVLHISRRWNRNDIETKSKTKSKTKNWKISSKKNKSRRLN